MAFYDYYDDLPPTGIGRAWVREQARHVLHHMREAAPHARRLMEIGPGHGIFADMCAADGLSYVALDINTRLLIAAQARGLTGVRAMAPALPLAHGCFDITFASHVIEHSPGYREALALLHEMGRATKAGGLVVLVAPDYLELREDFWNCDYSHSFVTTRRRLRQIMRDAGLSVIGEHSLYGPLEGASGQFSGALIGNQLMSTIARAVPGKIGERLYKLRLTFAHALLMIGRVAQ
ncbi:MAG: methyltransferase domain-containing protein [Roseiflexaceae bacterium]|nr:methyltransferase domain-containing protein [Roseiflexaceae bacterium]